MTDCTDSQKAAKKARRVMRRYIKFMKRAPMKGRGGPSFPSLLALLFIGLKLTGHIDWSWWWVLSPLWSRVLIVLLIIAAAVSFMKKTGRNPSGET